MLRLVVPTVVAVAALAGCSSDDEPTTDPTPSASSGPTSTPLADRPGGDLVPATFPEAEVPLADGEIGEVLENEELGGFLVKVYPDSDFPTAFEQARELLEDLDFEQEGPVMSAGPSSSTATWVSPDWEVLVTGGLPERTLLQYTIYPR